MRLANLAWFAMLLAGGCGGGDPERGGQVFAAYCQPCHSLGTTPITPADHPIRPMVAGRDEARLFDVLGRLAEIDEKMPPFPGSDADRKDVAAYLAELGR